MELEEAREAFAAQGLGVCSISYDRVEVLAHFAARKGITFPLLSDPGSEIIRRFGLLNTTIPETDRRQYGIPHPGTFIINTEGIVLSKFFEEHFIHRVTMPTILARGLGMERAHRFATARTDQVSVTALAPQERVRPGNRLTLTVEVTPASGVHLYAPGAEGQGYHPVAFAVEAPPHCTVHAPTYPPAGLLEIPGLGDRVPAYTDPIRILVDLSLGSRQDLADALAAGRLAVHGRLWMQACDERVCYPPQEVPLVWDLVLEAPDTERVPEALRRELAEGAM